MKHPRIHQSARKNRRRGAQAAEFAGAIVLLIFALIPLVDLGIMIVRWNLASSIVNSFTRQLALCESFSAAHKKLEGDPNIFTTLENLGGVHPVASQLTLIITSKGKDMVIERPRTIPAAWLPDANQGRNEYNLELAIDVEIAPLIVFPSFGKKIPGLTGAYPTRLVSHSHWENLGRNPATQEFFINE